MAKRNDRHHIFFPRRAWRTGYAKELRNHWYCIITLPRLTEHRFIHENVSEVPVPDGLICKEALNQLAFLDEFGALHETDDIASRLRLLICLLDNGDSPTAEALKAQLKIFKPP